MKYLNLKPTNALMYLLLQLRKGYDKPTNAAVLCDALKYVVNEPRIDWKTIFANLNSPSFISKCGTGDYSESPEVISFALKDDDEQNYIRVYEMVTSSGIAARPHHSAVCKAVLYAYHCYIAQSSQETGEACEVPFDELSLDDKLKLIDTKISYLIQRMYSLEQAIKHN